MVIYMHIIIILYRLHATRAACSLLNEYTSLFSICINTAGCGEKLCEDAIEIFLTTNKYMYAVVIWIKTF